MRECAAVSLRNVISRGGAEVRGGAEDRESSGATNG
jgi:hypothetical protein